MRVRSTRARTQTHTPRARTRGGAREDSPPLAEVGHEQLDAQHGVGRVALHGQAPRVEVPGQVQEADPVEVAAHLEEVLADDVARDGVVPLELERALADGRHPDELGRVEHDVQHGAVEVHEDDPEREAREQEARARHLREPVAAHEAVEDDEPLGAVLVDDGALAHGRQRCVLHLGALRAHLGGERDDLGHALVQAVDARLLHHGQRGARRLLALRLRLLGRRRGRLERRRLRVRLGGRRHLASRGQGLGGKTRSARQRR